MMKIEDIIAQLLEASGGEIVGRIRLQKMIYLLDQMGLGSGLQFTYHHYGPYAESTSIAVQRAEIINKTITETEIESSYGGRYSIFKLVSNLSPSKVGGIDFEVAKTYASQMKKETSVVLELAATIHWLKKKEKVENWQNELVARKPNKANAQNIEKALALLAELNLAA